MSNLPSNPAPENPTLISDGPSISLFASVLEDTVQAHIPLARFLEDIQTGKWQDLILPIRACKDDKKRIQLKKSLPNVTLSGTFQLRKDDGLIVHSGVIGIDIDDIDDPEEMKDSLSHDPHVYAMFTSISGRGLCVIIPVDGKKHRESFEGLQQYFQQRYGLIIDPTGINTSRARYVSYDPHIYVNVNATKYEPTIEELQRINGGEKTPQYIFTVSDFEHTLRQIEDRTIDITEGYKNWLKIGFAIASQFDEHGRQYFHRVSQFNAEYNKKITDRQYTACLKAGKTGVRINTFFYIAKQFGITIVTDQTKKISDIVDQLSREKKTTPEIHEYLAKEGMSGPEVISVVEQVLQGAGTGEKDKTKNVIELVERWIRTNYEIKKNKYTRTIEVNGEPLTDSTLNSIWISIAKVHPKVPFITVARVLESDFVPLYDPFQDFIKTNTELYPREVCRGNIQKLFDTIQHESAEDAIETSKGLEDYNPEQETAKLFDFEGAPLIDTSYKYDFGRKWIIGLVAAMHGEVVPLMLVLTGLRQNTGKTEWFRRLLPRELQHYYAESKLDAGKDAEILMSKKLIIMDDEMGGKSKLEAKRLKELTSADTFTLREPYGRVTVELKRLAVLCGTSNDHEIITDQTGNRRIIPISVGSINHELYNSIDKRALLMEAYYAYEDGEDFHLKHSDIERMLISTGQFETIHMERELVRMYMRKPTTKDPEDLILKLTSTELKIMFENATGQKINQTKLGMELKRYKIKRYLSYDPANRAQRLWQYHFVQVKPLQQNQFR